MHLTWHSCLYPLKPRPPTPASVPTHTAIFSDYSCAVNTYHAAAVHTAAPIVIDRATRCILKLRQPYGDPALLVGQRQQRGRHITHTYRVYIYHAPPASFYQHQDNTRSHQTSHSLGTSIIFLTRSFFTSQSFIIIPSSTRCRLCLLDRLSSPTGGSSLFLFARALLLVTMCIQVIERYSVCKCVYYKHAVDRCAQYGTKGHSVEIREVLVGYTCSDHSFAAARRNNDSSKDESCQTIRHDSGYSSYHLSRR